MGALGRVHADFESSTRSGEFIAVVLAGGDRLNGAALAEDAGSTARVVGVLRTRGNGQRSLRSLLFDTSRIVMKSTSLSAVSARPIVLLLAEGPLAARKRGAIARSMRSATTAMPLLRGTDAITPGILRRSASFQLSGAALCTGEQGADVDVAFTKLRDAKVGFHRGRSVQQQ